MTYSEKSTQLALDASVAVLALMGTAPDDLEFIPLKPKAADETLLAELKARWPGRGLRSVGVIGLCGTSPCFALKAPLEPEQVSALADAFLDHLHGVYCDGLAEQTEAELKRLWSLPDNRLN